MVKYTIDSVELAWTDQGNKMWHVYLTREDGSQWVLRDWARDELEAYKKATAKLEGAD